MTSDIKTKQVHSKWKYKMNDYTQNSSLNEEK